VVFEPPHWGTSTVAVDINDNGQVAIGSETGVLLWERGTYWSVGAGSPTAINAEGQILGINGQGVTIFRKGQPPRSLGFVAIPTGINDRGDVTSYVRPGCRGCPSHALHWHDGILTTLDPSPGSPGQLGARALGLNNAGEVVGTSGGDPSTGQAVALVWRDGRPVDLGRFGGDRAEASGINDRGQILVTSRSEATGLATTLLIDGDRAQTLGTPSGWGGDHAAALNNVGDVIGTSNGSPFLWRRGVMIDIRPLIPPTSGLTVIAVTGINNSGTIVGHGYDINGNSRGFLLELGG
jgi:probable HAF family extracellular repeat protein